MADVPFACECGQVHGKIQNAFPTRGTRLVCYCQSCQTAACVLGKSDRLDDLGGTHVFQTLPGDVQFASGKENLACLRLSPKGLLRFYASCCDAPLFNMPNQPRLGFAGLNLDRVAAQDLSKTGDIKGVHSVKTALKSTETRKDYGIKRAAIKVLWRALVALLRGDSSAPFFDAQGQIAAPVRVLSLEERRHHVALVDGRR